MITRSGVVGSSRISTLSPAHYVLVSSIQASTVANGVVISVYIPWSGRIVDMAMYQFGAGTVGTSYTVDVKTVGGTSLLSTLGVATQASGADKATDARGEIALPSGWTRPVLKTDSTVVVTKGSRLTINSVETGAYSTHPSLVVHLYIEPPL